MRSELRMASAHSTTRMITDRCWEFDTIENIKGTPWRPDPNKYGFKIPTQMQDGGDEDVEDDEGEHAHIIDDDEMGEVEKLDIEQPKGSAYCAKSMRPGRGANFLAGLVWNFEVCFQMIFVRSPYSEMTASAFVCFQALGFDVQT